MSASGTQPTTHPIPFEEFKLMYESTERVTDRRIELARTNSSLCTLVIAGLGVTAAWAHGRQDVELTAAAIIVVISLLGIVFCRFWSSQIEAYKDLNGAKFDVLDELSDRVVFPGYPAGVKSSKPFAREWEFLQQKKALQRYKGGFALGSTASEFVVPMSFLIFFLLVALCALGFAVSISRIL
ncbi:MAG: hypothetical protein WDM91_03135 [Rhizomicrobium sp.]